MAAAWAIWAARNSHSRLSALAASPHLDGTVGLLLAATAGDAANNHELDVGIDVEGGREVGLCDLALVDEDLVLNAYWVENGAGGERIHCSC